MSCFRKVDILFAEQIEKSLRLVEEDISYRAFRLDDTVFKYASLLSDLTYYFHLVGDHDNRDSELLVDLEKKIEDGVGGLRVKR